MPHMVTVKDDATGLTWSYDADKPMLTADDGLAFFVSQLANVESKIYETKYQNIRYAELVPVDMSDPEWVDEITYFSYDAVTMGKFIGANPFDLPQSDITMNKSTIPVHYAGNSIGYSLDELRKSAALRMPVDTTKAAASRRGADEHAQKVCFNGDSDRGGYGLFNHPNVQTSNSSVDWSIATGAEIVEDMNQTLLDVWENSAQVHVPNTMLIPSDRWAQITSQRMDSGTDTTVLEFFRQNNLAQSLGVTLDVRAEYFLRTAGANSTGRMMAYEKNADNVVFKMPLAYRMIAPQPEALGIKVPAEYKMAAGVEFRYPGSAAYRDFPV